MSVLLLLVLPLLVEGSPSHGESCRLPPASTEKFDCIPADKTWHLQYQYKVPGLFDLGCSSFYVSQGKFPNEMHVNGSFSRIPAFPAEATVKINGNRFQLMYHGIWNCALSGPCNIVYFHDDFHINHICFLGHEVSQIFTTVRKPCEKLMARIWQAVEDHPEVDKHKYVKVVC